MRSSFICITTTLLAIMPWSNAQCDVCPDGSNVTKVDAVIPFFSVDESFADPTCGQLEVFSRLASLPSCDAIHAQAGFCGCAGIEPVNACKLCPSGDVGSPNKLTPAGDSCADVVEYVSFLSEQDCTSERGQQILGHAFFCECPGVQAECSLCADGQELPDPNQEIPNDLSCGQAQDVVSTFNAALCESSSRNVVVNGVRCDCRGQDEFPACPIQQNVAQCTPEMLDAVDEECECYTFCDGEFTGCTLFPGAIIQASQCAGTAISGCNYANAGTGQGGSGAAGRSLSLLTAVVASTLCLVSY